MFIMINNSMNLENVSPIKIELEKVYIKQSFNRLIF